VEGEGEKEAQAVGESGRQKRNQRHGRKMKPHPKKNTIFILHPPFYRVKYIILQ